MTIKQRLYGLIGIAAVVMTTLAWLGIYQMEKVYTATNYANVNTVPSLLNLDESFKQYARLRVSTWTHLALRDPQQKSDMKKRIGAARATLQKAVASYEKENLSDDTDRQLLVALRNTVGEYDAAMDRVLALSDAEQLDAAIAMLVGQEPLILRVTAAFDAQRKYNADLGRRAADHALETKSQALHLALAIALLSISVLVVTGVIVIRKISRSLSEAIRIARTVASGDLTSRIETDASDETGQLILALKEMNQSLAHIVGEVRTGADMIATASSQIASGNLDLSSRTEEQASSLEETAASLEELTTTVKQNADHARTANQLALSAAEVAAHGGAVVAQVVDTMDSIDASSKKIVDIIAVIDSIAFQTNILALNAAVEAARAGEQGRGFAVVASEVRNLAHRSATAAQEIKALIGDSVHNVDAGSKLVTQAGTTMQAIVDSINSVTTIMARIAVASGEQTSGIEQINHAITQMDEVTQQNSALVEEAAAAAGSLKEQAAALSATVSVFKTAQWPAPARAAIGQARERQPAARQAAAAHRAPLRIAARG